MCKRIFGCIILLFVSVVLSLCAYAYNRVEAVQYVEKWTDVEKGSVRNPQYNFYGKNDTEGSDCANFVSQALIAGCYSQAFINRPDSGMNRWTIPNAKDLGDFLEPI